MSLREQIISRQDLPSEQLPIPEWGCTVEVRGMTAQQRAQFLEDNFDDKGKPVVSPLSLYPGLVVAHTFDPATGERVFTDADVDALGEKAALVLERIAQKALSLSSLQPSAVDDAAKKSEELPSDGST